MRFKLNENIGTRGLKIFQEAGHEISTVKEEGLSGQTDQKIYEACLEEKRVLVTLDHDFGNTLRFDPRPTEGIAILEVPAHLSLEILLILLRIFLAGLQQFSIQGKLWIMEPGRIRIHQYDDDES